MTLFLWLLAYAVIAFFVFSVLMYLSERRDRWAGFLAAAIALTWPVWLLAMALP